MPYTPSSPNLPSNVKKIKSEKRRQQWCDIWNSTYNSCTAGGGSAKDCEAKAFRNANGVIKNEKEKGK